MINESRRSIRPPWPGRMLDMSLIPRSRLIGRLDEVTRGRPHGRRRSGDQPDPPGAVQREVDAGHADRHAEDHRTGEPLPRLLGTDRRRHRVPPGEDPHRIPADVARDGDAMKVNIRHAPSSGARSSEEEPGEERAGRRRRAPPMTSRAAPTTPSATRQTRIATQVRAKQTSEGLGAADVGRAEHADAADDAGHDRDVEPTGLQRAGAAPDADADRGGREDDERPLRDDEQRHDHGGAEGRGRPRTRRAGCGRRGRP